LSELALASSWTASASVASAAINSSARGSTSAGTSAAGLISSLTDPPQGDKTLSAMGLSTTELVCECQTEPHVEAALMFVLPGYDAFLGFLLIAAAVPVLALVTNKLLAPRSQAGERELTYESGMEPIGGAWIQFNIRYYMFALVFVIFDVETVFLYPWAVAFHRLGLLAFIEALVFITILLVALAYAWRKGALEWS
jgi:NAD(P)H-quinone oxidoreductase subunit 3